MPEPTTTATTGTGLAALAVALLGPLTGQHALIVFGALAGALWPLSEASTQSHRAGAWLLLRVVLMAVVFTGLVAHVLQRYAGIEPDLSLGPIAFCIAALGNGWRPVMDTLGDALRRWARRANPEQQGRKP